MQEERIRAKLVDLAAELAALGVKSLSLFGSATRGTTTAESDLDFLVEYEGMATFDRYMGLKELLEREFQTPIDLVTVRSLKPQIRDRVLLEAVSVA
jgi:predicted nucleotidyltransferase